MKKKILMVIIIIILIKIVVLSVITITNKTFYKEYYETKNSLNEKVRIPLPLFSYYETEKDSTVTFSTLKSVKKVGPILNKYVENLQSCYDEGYFYDKDLDITISRYHIEDSFPFNKIYLKYISGNYCENEYVLDDNWMTDVIENAVINGVNIDRCFKENDNMKCDSKPVNNIEEILNYVSDKEVTRIENKNNIDLDEGNDYYAIFAYYTIEDKGYTLTAFPYNDNLAFMVTDSNDHTKNAIYDIEEDVNQIFKNIYDNYTNE